MIYFDNAATSKPCRAAITAFNNTVEKNFGNPSSLHTLGIEAEKTILSAKETLLKKFPTQNAYFVFTSGATESNNLALSGAYEANFKNCGVKIVATAIAHKSAEASIENLKKLKNNPAEIMRLSPKDFDGSLSFENGIIAAVDDKTVIASIIAVNNETGYIIDTERVYNRIKRKNPNCIVHVDGVQGFLKIPLFGDIISVSSHKIHGIKGMGGLYIKKGIRINPIFSGGEQQGGLRPGTEAVELIAAFEAAALDFNYDKVRYQNLCGYILQLLNEKLGVNNIRINSFNNLPNILNFSVKGIKSEVMTHYLAENDIYVSSGSACARGKKSEVLPHFGLNMSDVDSALRLSFSADNTEREIEIFSDVISAGVKRFKK